MERPEEFVDPNKNREETDIVSDLNTSECADDLYRVPENSGDGGKEQEQGENPYTGSPNYGPGENQREQSGSPYHNGDYYNGNDHNDNDHNSNDHNSYYHNSNYHNGNYHNSNYHDGNYHNSDYQNGPDGNNPHGYNPYGNQQGQSGSSYDSNNPYGNGSYGSQQGQNGSLCGSNNPYGNPYSPYAAPAKGTNIKLVIGIVAGIIILFLIAVFALTYKAVSLFSEERARRYRDDYEEHVFHDDREQNREKRRKEDGPDSYDYDNHYGDDYNNDDYYDDDYNNDYYDDDYYNDDYYDDDYDYDNDEYYTLHDDIREDLSYTVEFDYYEYDTNNEDVEIAVTYPVIAGDHVPNLDQLNTLIQSEIDLFEEYYEEGYIDYMEEEDSYFWALSSGYVTFMDEERLSIVFSEYIYTDNYDYAYLYSINIDMENGVVLDNENILRIDDDFSVEFRKRSDIQNGEITYLTGMTDQEITDYFNSEDIIVFYTPHGMEIGFNYEMGWVTVTYEEYEQYLNVF